MDRTRIISGKLVGPRLVELDEPVNASATVEVVVRERDDAVAPQGSLLDFLQSLPPGTRSREDIDAQVEEERSAWEERE